MSNRRPSANKPPHNNGNIDRNGIINEEIKNISTPPPQGVPSITEAIDSNTERYNENFAKVQTFQELTPAQSPIKTPQAVSAYRPVDTLAVIGKKEGMHYIWIQNNSQAIYECLQSRIGSQVCTDKDVMPGFMTGTDATGQFTGAKIYGDLILMEMPIQTENAYKDYWKSQIKDPAQLARQVKEESNSFSQGITDFSGEFESSITREKI